MRKWLNPHHQQADLNLLQTLCSIMERQDFDVSLEREVVHEVDYLPSFKFKSVSELAVKLSLMKEIELKMLCNDLQAIGREYGWYDYQFTPRTMKYSYQEYIERMVSRIYKKYGNETYIESSHFNQDINERIRIVKVRYLEGIQGIPMYHGISWMPCLYKICPASYSFFIDFFSVCVRAGINEYWSDISDMIAVNMIDNAVGELESTKLDNDPEYKKRLEDIITESLCYKSGIAHNLSVQISKSQASYRTIMDSYNKWQWEKNISLPKKQAKDLQIMCEMLAQGIDIGYYEKHHNTDMEDELLSNTLAYGITYDLDNFADEMESYINSIGAQCGVIELADSMVITKECKMTFMGQGRQLEQFLSTWNKTDLFRYMYDTYKSISSLQNGTEIRNSNLQRKKRSLRSKKAVC